MNTGYYQRVDRVRRASNRRKGSSLAQIEQRIAQARFEEVAITLELGCVLHAARVGRLYGEAGYPTFEAWCASQGITTPDAEHAIALYLEGFASGALATAVRNVPL